ncbi:MAG: hypothetical protein BGO12_04375 [Verrucomicrobia bacterium 61-8]|nr:MAG: hypothetical protein BGO12_04375 [Verrucomicrobia bacterium 61-8]
MQLREQPSLLGQLIQEAFNSGAKHVKVPPGIYRIDPLSSANPQKAALYIGRLKDCEVDLTGVTVVSTDVRACILFVDRCLNVTIRGGTFAYDPPAFSQGTIERISEDRRFIDIRISRGYPTNLDDLRFYFGNAPKILGIFEASTRDWKKNSRDIWFASAEKLAPDLFRFHLSAEEDLSTELTGEDAIRVGDLAAWRGYNHVALLYEKCEGLKILDMTVYNTGGFSVTENRGRGGNTYANCRIVRGPAPEGAAPGDRPLFSGACDGFHSIAMSKGPTYDGCYVEYTDDDAFAIHGYGSLVLEGDADFLIVAHQNRDDHFEEGTNLRLYDENGILAADAKVVSVSPLTSYNWKQNAPEAFRAFNQKKSENVLTYQKIRLDHPVSSRFAWMAINSDSVGSGFVIRNSKVYHNRGNAILAKGSNGLIENNVIEGPTIGGILFTPGSVAWGEVDYVRNITIRGNILRKVGLWNDTLAALNISEYRPSVGLIPLPGGHQDILVEDNTFEENDGIQVMVTSAQRVVFRNNRFIGAMQEDKGSGLGISAQRSLFWISKSRDITIEGNEIVRSGPLMKRVVEADESVENLRIKNSDE